MIKHLCTLFDQNYLTRGLALHESLQRHAPDSILHILTMDERSYELLEKMRLQGVRLIRLSDFEDHELLAIKATRTAAEYCWTVTPSLPLYVLRTNPEVDLISYIDADCFFYSSPLPIFTELGAKSVLIMEHRFSSDCRGYEAKSGRFNVGMLSFRRDATGLRVLEWWRTQCLNWCYARFEDGRYGDQLYLNQWPKLFSDGLYILEHKGGCVAPWNIWSYRIRADADVTYIDGDPLIFYHFHALRIFSDGRILPAEGYRFSTKQIKTIYDPYAQSLVRQTARVRLIDQAFSSGTVPERPVPAPISKIRWIVRTALKRWKSQLRPSKA